MAILPASGCGFLWIRQMCLAVFVLVLFGITATQEDNEGVADDNAEKIFNKTYADKSNALHKFLFNKYNRERRPVLNQSYPVDVYIQLIVLHISVDERKQTLTVHGWLHMTWYDDYLVWNPSDYDGVTETEARGWQIWQPDLKVANSVAGAYQHFAFSGNEHVVISATGKVYVEPRFSFKVGCKFDFSDYPNDDHTCLLHLITPPRMDEVILHTLFDGVPPINFGFFQFSLKTVVGNFNIYEISSNVTYVNKYGEVQSLPYTGEEMINTWSTITTYISMKRVAATYGVIVILPLFVSSLLSTCSCLMPSLAFALGINVTTIVLHILYVNEFVSRIPMTVSSTPSIVIYYCFSLVFTCLLSLFHLFLILCVRRQKTPTNLYNEVVTLIASGISSAGKAKMQEAAFIEWLSSLQEYRAWTALFTGVILLKTLVLANLF